MPAVSQLSSAPEIQRTGHAGYGFTVEIHPSGRSLYGSGEQIVLSGDQLLTHFDDFHEVFDEDPTVIESDDFVEALIDYIVAGVKTDIELLEEYADEIDEDPEPVITAYEAAIDDLKTELSVWVAEYRRYVRLAYPDSGIRDDHEIWEFEQSHDYDFSGILDTYDIIIDTLAASLND